MFSQVPAFAGMTKVWADEPSRRREVVARGAGARDRTLNTSGGRRTSASRRTRRQASGPWPRTKPGGQFPRRERRVAGPASIRRLRCTRSRPPLAGSRRASSVSMVQSVQGSGVGGALHPAAAATSRQIPPDRAIKPFRAARISWFRGRRWRLRRRAQALRRRWRSALPPRGSPRRTAAPWSAPARRARRQ